MQKYPANILNYNVYIRAQIEYLSEKIDTINTQYIEAETKYNSKHWIVKLFTAKPTKSDMLELYEFKLAQAKTSLRICNVLLKQGESKILVSEHSPYWSMYD